MTVKHFAFAFVINDAVSRIELNFANSIYHKIVKNDGSGVKVQYNVKVLSVSSD